MPELARNAHGNKASTCAVGTGRLTLNLGGIRYRWWAGARQRMEETSAKKWHAKALEVSKVEAFEPYCLRHTFGTRMAPKCDVFALARVMGHSAIRVTERYVHHGADAIERAFSQMLVTNGGYQPKMLAAGQDEEQGVTVSAVTK